MADDDTIHQIKTSIVRMESKLDQALDKGSRHSRLLYGETGANGLSGRVTTLEETEKRRSKQITALFGAVATGIAGVVANFFSPR